MKQSQLKALIAQGEGPKIEFKSILSLETPEEQSEFCKDVSSLANTLDRLGKNGYLIVGVADDGTIRGLSSPLDKRKIHNAIEKYLQPRLQITVEHLTVDSKLVAVIHIPSSYRKPHKFKTEFGKFKRDMVFTRALAEVRPASPEEIVALDQEAVRERRSRIIKMGVVSTITLWMMLVVCCLGLWLVLQTVPAQQFVYSVLPLERIPFIPDRIDASAAPIPRRDFQDYFYGFARYKNYEISFVYADKVAGVPDKTSDVQMQVAGQDYHAVKKGLASFGAKDEQYVIGDFKYEYRGGINPEHWQKISRLRSGIMSDYPINIAQRYYVSDILKATGLIQNEVSLAKLQRPGKSSGISCAIYRSNFEFKATKSPSVVLSARNKIVKLDPSTAIVGREETCIDQQMRAVLKYAGELKFKDDTGKEWEIAVTLNVTPLQTPPEIKLPTNILLSP